MASVIPTLVWYWSRHAEVEVRYHKIFGGTIDMNLSPRGQEQAGDPREIPGAETWTPFMPAR